MAGTEMESPQHTIQERRGFTWPGHSWALWVLICVMLGASVPILLGRLQNKWLLYPVALVLLIAFVLSSDQRRYLLILLVLSAWFQADFHLGEASPHVGGSPDVLVISAVDFPILALLALWLAEGALGRERHVEIGWIDLAIVAMILTSFLSLINSAALRFSLFEILRMFKMYLLFIVVRHSVRDLRDAKMVLGLLLAGAAFQSVLGIAQYVLGRSLGLTMLGESPTVWVDTMIGGGAKRTAGTMAHPNVLAGFLEMTLPISLAFLLSARSWRGRIPHLFILLLGGISLLFTYSRGGWGATAVGFGMVTFLSVRGLRERKSRVIGIGVLMVGIAVLALLPFKDIILTRLFETKGGSMTFRIWVTEIAAAMLRAHPLVGVGINTASEIVGRYDFTGLSSVWTFAIHNIYALTAAETGILGFAAFLAVLGIVVRRAWRLATAEDIAITRLGIGLFAGLSAHLLHGLVDWTLRWSPILVLFWILTGVVFSRAFEGAGDAVQTGVPEDAQI